MPFLVHAGRPYPFDGEAILGRTRECSIQIPDEKSSRRHARIWPSDGGWMIEDLASANGTRLNGKALINGPATLKPGDKISICKVDLVFRLELPQEESEAVPVLPEQLDPGLLNGREFADHHIDSLIGRSVTGYRYRAHHARANRDVLLTAIDQSLTADVEFPRRFQSAIEVVAGIQHPSVVRVHQCAKTNGVLWYSTELVHGDTVAQLLQKPVAPLAALSIAIRTAEALKAYHEYGLVHGDIQPASLTIDGRRTLRITDIGLIGLTNEEGRRLQQGATTRQVYYLCPAQAKGGQLFARSDIYSLGCLLVHLLTGRPPFEGDNFPAVVAAHLKNPVPQLAKKFGLTPKFDEILACMMHKDPFFRYEAMEFVVEELGSVRAILAAEAS
jgi:pSer/pThr/pTyr-binding forkhead associated (FHA) protein